MKTQKRFEIAVEAGRRVFFRADQEVEEIGAIGFADLPKH